MKPERGIMNLLILAEIVILVAALVFGTVKKLRPEDETADYVPSVSEADENLIGELSTETEDVEDTLVSAASEELAEQSTFSEEIQAKISTMSVEQKVAQMFLTSPEALTEQDKVTVAGEGTKSALGEFPVGGLVYSRTNFQGNGQFDALLTGAQRFSQEQSGEYLLLAATGNTAEGNAVTVLSGLYDVLPMVKLMQEEKIAAGVENILYPAVFTGGEETLDTAAACLFVGNGTADDITGEAGMPCSVSDGAMRHLRNTLGYQGLIITGNLSEESIVASYPDGQAAVMAVRAGADIVYQTADFKKAYQAVVDAVNAGEIPMERIDHAVGHILTQKENMPAPVEGDILAENGEDEEQQENNQRTNAEDVANAEGGNQNAEGQDVAQQETQNQNHQQNNNQQNSQHNNNNQHNDNNPQDNNQQDSGNNGGNGGEQQPETPPQDPNNGGNGGEQQPVTPPQDNGNNGSDQQPETPPQDNGGNGGEQQPVTPPQDNADAGNADAGGAENNNSENANSENTGTPGTESVSTEN